MRDLRNVLIIFLCYMILFNHLPAPVPELSDNMAQMYATQRDKNFQLDDEHLKSFYDAYNDEYFDGKLPRDTEVILDPTILAEKNELAETSCTFTGYSPRGEQLGLRCTIRISSYLRPIPVVSDEVELHEMCHVSYWARDYDSEGHPVDHGTKWRRCMDRLHDAGAFRPMQLGG